jgi:UDP-N-acetyl-D-glucosamine dehydrogenase
MTLKAKIEQREARIGVIGMGYVGLPLMVEYAHAGFSVLGIDVSEPKVESINRGESYIGDVTTEELAPLVEKGLISATADFARLRECDSISICVPTPLGKTKDPDMSYVAAATDEIAKNLRGQQLVILESTTYPGTTEELIQPRLEESGHKVGEDIFLAFSPERVDPGNPTYGVRNTPKVVGGVTPECTELAAELYRHTVDTVVAGVERGRGRRWPASSLENTYPLR